MINGTLGIASGFSTLLQPKSCTDLLWFCNGGVCNRGYSESIGSLLDILEEALFKGE